MYPDSVALSFSDKLRNEKVLRGHTFTIWEKYTDRNEMITGKKDL